ncbi:alpha/beta hydrolase [Flavobacterium enshiense]|uniref:alpha/beta hydrolase family protein n=1 Tax=Flavobacterium enshiense TaxID=1341165 RepID=UPI00345D2327
MKLLFKFFVLILPFVSFSQTDTFSKEEIVISDLIKGDLYTPKEENNKKALILLLAGSGPTNRNGNQLGAQNNSLKYLAEDLANNGYNVFTYDKRIFAQLILGNTNETEARFEDLITDASGVVDYFRKNRKYKKYIIAGHSEGALVGMLTAQHKKADAFISLAGAGRPIDEIVVEQIEKRSPSFKETATAYFKILKEGKTFKNETPALQNLFRESVQPYLISWLKYNPQEEIKKLKCPTLLINGDKDLQVVPKDAELLKQAKKDSELVILKNMNHVFKTILGDEKENMESYSNLNIRNHPELSTTIVKFLNTKL